MSTAFSGVSIFDDVNTSLSFIVNCGVILVLVFGFCLCFPYYMKAYRKNLDTHEASPLLPLISFSYVTIKYFYTTLTVSTIGCVIWFLVEGRFNATDISVFFMIFLAILMGLFAFIYQLIISILSIHRFINNRQAKEFRGTLSKKNVITVMVLVILFATLRNLVLFGQIFWITHKPEIDLERLESIPQQIKKATNYYYIGYVGLQVLLIIASIMELKIKESEVSHSEHVLVMHTICLGFIKLIFGAIYFICFVIKIKSELAFTLFFGIDLYLVPFIIEIVEIRSNSNSVVPSVARIFSK